MPYLKFNREKLKFEKLKVRKNKVFAEKDLIYPVHRPVNISNSGYEIVSRASRRIKLAIKEHKSVMLAFGAHTIKNGLAPVLMALMKDGWLTHLATNGAGIIHDWELAFQGKTSEDVRENIGKGLFGMWEETGFYINMALVNGAYEGLGYGESIGKMIAQEGLLIPESSRLLTEAIENMKQRPGIASSAIDLADVIEKYKLKPGFLKIPHPFRKYSVQACAWELGIPFTGHPMIGHDIIYLHPVNKGSAIGSTGMNDFLTFAESVSHLDNGVYISVGSAVMSPMIFEKALSMSQNIKMQEHQHIDNHYMLIVDLATSSHDWKNDGEPPENDPDYYLRHCKTFSRMGGDMDFLTADNRDFLPALYYELSSKN